MDRLIANENKNKSDRRDEWHEAFNEGRQDYRDGINIPFDDDPMLQREWEFGYATERDNYE